MICVECPHCEFAVSSIESAVQAAAIFEEYHGERPCVPNLCFDCAHHNAWPEDWPVEGDRCPHWRPDYWESLGYETNFGDAAVMGDNIEVVRRNTESEVQYVILASSLLRRPLELGAEVINGHLIPMDGY